MEVSNTCGIDGKRLDMANGNETVTRTGACSAAHPSSPSWNGAVEETRVIRLVDNWIGNDKTSGIERRYFGPWIEQSKDCSRARTRTTSRQARRTCSVVHPDGDSYTRDTGTETNREFFTGAMEQIVRVDWDETWVITGNNCYRTWTTTGTETRTSGCNREQRAVTNYWRGSTSMATAASTSR